MTSTLEELDKAMVAHSKWKHRLRDLVEKGHGEIDAASATRDDACELGKWLRTFHPAPKEAHAYNAVCHRHTEFHKSVGKIVLLVVMQKREEAKVEMGLHSAYMKSSAALTAEIMAWKKLL